MARKIGDKDKKKRKSRGLLTNTALLGGATAIGGYVGGKDSKVNALYKTNIKHGRKLLKYYKNDPIAYEEAIKQLNSKQVKQQTINSIKAIEETANKYKFLDNKIKRKIIEVRLNNKLNKIRNVSIGKGALIGAGIGTALLGVNELRNRMSKKK